MPSQAGAPNGATTASTGGTNLPSNRNINAVPVQYLGPSPNRDQATISYLGAQFPNPFVRLNPRYPGTISRGNLLRPFPPFGDSTGADPTG